MKFTGQRSERQLFITRIKKHLYQYTFRMRRIHKAKLVTTFGIIHTLHKWTLHSSDSEGAHARRHLCKLLHCISLYGKVYPWHVWHTNSMCVHYWSLQGWGEAFFAGAALSLIFRYIERLRKYEKPYSKGLTSFYEYFYWTASTAMVIKRFTPQKKMFRLAQLLRR